MGRVPPSLIRSTSSLASSTMVMSAARSVSNTDVYKRQLFHRALENRERRTYEAHTFDEVLAIARDESKNGFIKTMWCEDPACEAKMKEEAGLTSRCMPLEQEHLDDKCVCCGKPAKSSIIWGKAY